MLIRFELPDENTRLVSSLTVCVVGSESTGASLTAATLIAADAVAVLKAVSPPLSEASAVLPAVPLVWSQARKVTPAATLPLKFPAGSKRTRVSASAASSRAFPLLGLPKLLQLDPPSSEYCHVPLALFTPTTAMPESAPASTSVT